jgi:ATP-independent RNA helicase DbpA
MFNYARFLFMSNQFRDFDLKEELLKNLEELGFDKMTPIQEKSLPLALKGDDLIGQAKTGSGKTAAFSLGILNDLKVKIQSPQALILCPTRELAEQVAVEIRKLARMLKNVKVVTITGGTGYHHQESSLDHGSHIIVGTPGRVAKLIKTKFITLREIKTFVLDEADRMLDMGFYDEIMGIESLLSENRQTLLFSATFPEAIVKLSENVQRSATMIKIDSLHEEGNILQHFYRLESHKDKNKAVLRLLSSFLPERSIIFCKTKVITKNLTKFLKENGLLAEGIHGDLDQKDRTKVLTKFSNQSLSILVATDVAARGLDIKDLSAVINYDLPMDSEDYVHRIGRTGRAGKKGLAFSFYLEPEEYRLEEISEILQKECPHSELPELKEFEMIPPMKTLFIAGGKKQKLRPGDILGAMVKEAGLEPNDVGDISILPITTYVAVKKEKINQAISKLSSGKIKNRSFRIGYVD